jgi:hypothetical protein
MDDAVAPTAGSGRAKGLGDLKALRPTLMGRSNLSGCILTTSNIFLFVVQPCSSFEDDDYICLQ